MKKIIISMFMCVISLTFVLSGCGVTPLKNSPTDTAEMKVNGSALVYDDYIYFANSFKASSDLKSGQNKSGSVKNPAIYRVATTNGEVAYDEDTNLPKNLEKAISKVAGFGASSYMISVGEYIYFASPSVHKNDQNENTFNLNSYFKVKTDGSGLDEFYTSKNAITQQQYLVIDGKHYLFVVDGTKLVRFTLGTSSVSSTTLASDFTNIILPTQNDSLFAYYLVGVSDEDKDLGREGSYIYKLNLKTGNVDKDSNNKDMPLNPNSPTTMTLEQIYNNKLFLTITDSNDLITYAYLTTSFNYTEISTQLSSNPFTDFVALTADNNTEYYVFVEASKTYVVPNGTTNISANVLLESTMTILFVDGDYVYYSVADSGIYRISIHNKNAQQISDKTAFKTEGISFDGTYIYFYATFETTAENPTNTYYMHRAEVFAYERNGECNVEMISQVLEADEPEIEEE